MTSNSLRSEIEPAPHPLAALRRAVAVPGRLLGALLAPDRTLPTEVAAGRYGAALLAAILAALVSAAAVGARIDMTHAVMTKNPVRTEDGVTTTAPPPGSNRPAEDEVKSDREIDEQITHETAVERVKLGLGAGLGTPLELLLLAIGLYLLARYVGGKPTLRGSMVTAVHGALPGAVKAVLVAVAAWRTPSLQLDEIPSLAAAWPAAPNAVGIPRLLAAADPFALWSAVILGFGLAAAAGISRKRAFAAIGIGFLLYLVVTQLVAGSPPPPAGAP